MRKRKIIIPQTSPDLGDCSLDILDEDGNMTETQMFFGQHAYAQCEEEFEKHPHRVIYRYTGWEHVKSK